MKLIYRDCLEFSRNPRETARFINIFRMEYFILSVMKARRLSVPTLNSLTRWIILSIKWPALATWITNDFRWSRYGGGNLNRYDGSGGRLLLLEELTHHAKDFNEWQKTFHDFIKDKSDYLN